MSDQEDEGAIAVEAEKTSGQTGAAFSTDEQDTDSAGVSDIEKGQDGAPVEEQLAEDELRRLYEEEEIERFLGLFADVSLCSVCPIHELLIALAVTSMLRKSKYRTKVETRLQLLITIYGKIGTQNLIHLRSNLWITNGSQ